MTESRCFWMPREKMAEQGVSVPMFTDEELSEIRGVKKGDGFVEVTCGCTSPRYGDYVGRLKIYASGELEIRCECAPGCPEDKLSPSDFEKHSGRETARRWKYNVWVTLKGKKVPLVRTALLKHYDQATKSSNGSHKGPYHRDEFIRCTKCNKERRFRLTTKEECRIHHDALADPNWKCSDLPFDETSCDDEEERASRKLLRGCSRRPLCKGCTSCVCFGCGICRFSDCSCRICTDFTVNADI